MRAALRIAYTALDEIFDLDSVNAKNNILTAPDHLMGARLVPKEFQVKAYFAGFAVLEQLCGRLCLQKFVFQVAGFAMGSRIWNVEP